MPDRTSVKVIADSVGFTRLTTIEAEFPRKILAEVNTHRDFSRNSRSSRAIPVEKVIAEVLADPYIPEKFGINQKGMSATEYVVEGDPRYDRLAQIQREASIKAVTSARAMLKYNVHKQDINRLLEPFLWHTAIISSTEWDNFFRLRCDEENTEPSFYKLACMIRDTLSDPDQLLRIRPMTIHDWHLPYIGVGPEDSELSLDQKIEVSIARCARVSYLTQDGIRDIDKDLELYQRLAMPGHLSPFEHAATPTVDETKWANFKGWEQARWAIEQAHGWR